MSICSRKKTAAVLVLFLVFLSGTLFGEELILSGMTFTGLKNISGHSLVKQSGIRQNGKEIRADLDKLREVLGKEPLVESFSISLEGSVLTVNVKEKKVVACVAVTAGRSTVPVMIGDDFTILSVSGFGEIRGPLFVTGMEQVKDNRMSGEFAAVFAAVKSVERDYPALYREMEEVRFRNGKLLEIKLKKRPVNCFLVPLPANFKRLNYAVGYMDASGHYPDVLKIDGDTVVIR